MKKYLLILIICLLVLLSACKTDKNYVDVADDKEKASEKTIDKSDEEMKYKVTYQVTYGGELIGDNIQEVKKGESTEPVTVRNIDGYHFVKWSDELTDKTRSDSNICCDSYFEAIFERDSYEFPNLYLTLDASLTITKESYIDCSATLANNNNRDDNFTNIKAKIKGRGNSTWNQPKKPYKLKFDKKVDVMGLGKAKTWVLLANYCDFSEIRNYIGFKISDYISNDSSFVTDFCYVNLYMNDDYVGLYLLCEQVEIKENRVDICDSLSSYDTGYLVEVDGRYPNNIEEIAEAKLDYNYFMLDDLAYVIKGPDFEDDDYNSIFCATIKNYITTCFNAVNNQNYANIKELIDVESFADQYIVQELTGNVDTYWTSFYFYKDKGGKLVCGPVWDLDISAGNMNYNYKAKSTSYLYAKERCTWFNYLLKIPEFKTLVKEKLENNYEGLKNLINYNLSYIKYYHKEFEKDLTKWDTLNADVWNVPNDIKDLGTWKANVNYVRDWLLESLENLLDYYCQ